MAFEHQVAALVDDQGATLEERALIDDEVGAAELQGEGVGVNRSWRLELGATSEGAFFKPVNGVNHTVASMFGHTRETVFLAEVAAYRLAYALGGPFAAIVPPCVIRTVPEVDADAPGALSAERFDQRAADVFFHAPQAAMRGAFFDALIANQDRSRGNLLFDAARDDLALIDHGFCFPRDEDLRHNALLVEWRRRGGMCELDDDETAALHALLNDPDLLGLRRYLDADRVDPVAERAERMLGTGSIV